MMNRSYALALIIAGLVGTACQNTKPAPTATDPGSPSDTSAAAQDQAAHTGHPGLQENAKSQEYTCPMHPEIRQSGPGTCPQCKMDLVPTNQK